MLIETKGAGLRTDGTVVRDCLAELAINFDESAIAIVAKYGRRLGMSAGEMQTLIESANGAV